jgi:hydroxymethylbilane synthase
LSGLKRLGRSDAATAILSVDEFLPAVGQGAICIEARLDDVRTRGMLAAINDVETMTAVTAERAFLAVLDGSCRTPIGGHAVISGSRVHFRGLIVRPDGSEAHAAERAGESGEAKDLAIDAGRELRSRGGPGFFAG